MIVRLAALLLLAWLLGFAWFAIALPGPARAGRTDGIVVVTGGTGRVDHALALLRTRQAQRLLVSGADRRVRPLELAEAYHVPPRLVTCCVDLGHEAVDTRSNADESARWIADHRYRSVRLVTTDWHMRRARYELSRAVGVEVTIVPDAVRSEPGFVALFKEYHKYLWRRLTAPLGI